MTEFKDKIEQTDKPSEIPVSQPDIPTTFDPTKMSENSATESKQFFDNIFKTLGLISNTENKSDTSENRENDEVDCSEYLEQEADGKYRDKETGKVYDSIDEWKAKQETAAKRYYGAADYFEHKAKQEWAKFKSSEDNGESEKEKWEHYRKSQEYYAKAKKCREKGDAIMKKIGQNDIEAQKDHEYRKNDELSNRVIRYFPKVLDSVIGTVKDLFEDFQNEPEIRYEALPISNEVKKRFEKFDGKQLSELNEEEKKELIDLAVDRLRETYGDVISPERYEKIKNSFAFVEIETVMEDLGKPFESAIYTMGYYSPSTDGIKINTYGNRDANDVLETIEHEAIHMMSKDFKSEYGSGVKTFSQNVPGYNKGMNEGITQMYTIRNILGLYPEYISNAYDVQVSVMQKFEAVYGAEKLKDVYFSNDFDKLRTDYDSVMGKGEFYKFCNLMDKMHEDYDYGRTSSATAKMNQLLSMIEQYDSKLKGDE